MSCHIPRKRALWLVHVLLITCNMSRLMTLVELAWNALV